MLPLFLGRATRLVEYHLGDAKRYRATVCFGATSTTDDLEGELTPVDGPPPTGRPSRRRSAASAATIEQGPPAYSAVKVAGRRAYAMARAGETVELAPRAVTIDALDLVDWDETTAGRPIAILDVGCSAGTYVRALARDLGAAVGCGAYLGALVRTASGPFTLDDATGSTPSARPPRTARLRSRRSSGRSTPASTCPSIAVPDAALGAIGRGQAIGVPAGVGALCRPTRRSGSLDGAGRLVAIARLAGTKLAPDKVLRRRRRPPRAGRDRRVRHDDPHGRRRARRPAETAGCSSSSACSTASISATPTCSSTCVARGAATAAPGRP